MADELKDQRVPIMMSASGLKAVDDWMFESRIRSRGEAIRQLADLGMNYQPLYEAYQASGKLIKALISNNNTEKELLDWQQKNAAYLDSVEKLVIRLKQDLRSTLEVHREAINNLEIPPEMKKEFISRLGDDPK